MPGRNIRSVLESLCWLQPRRLRSLECTGEFGATDWQEMIGDFDGD